jgi:Rab-GTPase-TBC domain
LDPLTAMVQEQARERQRQEQLELQYQREKVAARQQHQPQRSTNTGNGPSAAVAVQEESCPRAAYHQLIAKNLHRLPHPHDDSNESQYRRIQVFGRVLYVYACAHATSGYVQGMHEIALYVLYALEVEQPTSAIAQNDGGRRSHGRVRHFQY